MGHDLVGWVMWDERAKAGLGELGFPNTGVWIVAWRLAGLGNTPHPVAAAMTYSIHPGFIEAIRGMIDAVTTNDAVLGVLDSPDVGQVDEQSRALAARGFDGGVLRASCVGTPGVADAELAPRWSAVVGAIRSTRSKSFNLRVDTVGQGFTEWEQFLVNSGA